MCQQCNVVGRINWFKEGVHIYRHKSEQLYMTEFSQHGPLDLIGWKFQFSLYTPVIFAHFAVW